MSIELCKKCRKVNKKMLGHYVYIPINGVKRKLIDRVLVKKLKRKGWPVTKIADKLNCGTVHIYRILNSKKTKKRNKRR